MILQPASIRLHRQRVGSILTAATILIALIALFFDPRPANMLQVFAAACVALVVAMRLRRKVDTLDGALDVGNGAMTVVSSRRGPRRFSFARIGSVRRFPRASGHRVEIAFRDGVTLDIDFDRVDDSDQLLRATGHGPEHRVFRASLGSRANRATGLACVFVASFVALLQVAWNRWGAWNGLFFLVEFLALAAASGAITYAVGAFFRPPVVTVGTEGLDVRVSVWRYLVPFRQLESVRMTVDQHLRFAYADGRTRTLYVSAPPEDVDALLMRIEDARAIYARREAAHQIAALGREGRAVAAWRDALVARLRGAANYRDESLDRENLLRVLDDPDARAEHRIGAAIAVAASDATRVRVAASTCANEPLRVALERAADRSLDDHAVDDAIEHERTARRL